MTNTSQNSPVAPLRIKGVFLDAWRQIHGVKLPIFGALFVQALILMVLILIGVAVTTLFQHSGTGVLVTVAQLSNIVQFLVGATLTIGILNIAVTHLQGKPVRFYQVFRGFHKSHLLNLWALLIVYLLINVSLGKCSTAILMHGTSRAVLLPILGILILEAAIAFAMAFTFLLVLRQQYNAWQALRHMLQKVGQHGPKLLLLFIFLFIIGVVCLLPILVGTSYFVQLHHMQISFNSLPWVVQAKILIVGVLNLSYIWTIPWLINVIAVTYRDVFRTDQV